MKKVISASRRTDLIAFFPDWLALVIKNEKTIVHAPSGKIFTADLRPENVHTFVLWSKNYINLIKNNFGLKELLGKYDQLYFHLTVTGLGGTPVEEEVPKPSTILSHLEDLIEISKHPKRISVRFDPIVFWEEEGFERSNLDYFEELAPRVSALGIENIRFSFAQWYRKALRRAAKHSFRYLDPSDEEKIEKAHNLRNVADLWDLNLFSCSQDFLTVVPGIQASSCIDGSLLQSLHPSGEPVSQIKDKSQRKDCGCTESVDIGSYTQRCPHSCLYCYAN